MINQLNNDFNKFKDIYCNNNDINKKIYNIYNSKNNYIINKSISFKIENINIGNTNRNLKF